MEISINKERRKNKKYGPDLSEISAVSIRRLAWAMNTNMGKAIEIIVRASPMILNTEKICSICKDKKCLVCAFKCGSFLPQKIIPMLYKPGSTANP
jgi:hypothetical protein